jgi:hypothetical protein
VTMMATAPGGRSVERWRARAWAMGVLRIGSA